MINAEELISRAQCVLLTKYHKSMSEADAVQLHTAIAEAAMEALTPVWMKSEKARSQGREAAYFSAEYLMGRMVFNNLYCLGVLEEVRTLLRERGVDLAMLEDIEDDAFGNGGLGRLAACFLDSAATLSLPLTGYGLRYRFGLFKQRFEDGRQKEEPDDWAKYGDPWSIRRDDESVLVAMKTGTVRAVPYDMPVIGCGAAYIGTLRLWQCESLVDTDFALFNEQEYAKAVAAKNQAEDITKFLYPNDTKLAGKQLRVQQQYVLVSASLQDMLRRYEREGMGDLRDFAAHYAVQLNDTHPVMAIPELIRLMMDRGMSFEEAFGIARDTFSYTNHTVMQEALEKWDLSLLESVAPEMTAVMHRIDQHFRQEMAAMDPVLVDGKDATEITPSHCIIEGSRIHMAQLAVYGTHATNGVAAIHSELVKSQLFPAWYAIYPERFQNKTNGITPRRWLGLCNPELTALLEEEIGKGFITDLDRLQKLKSVLNSPKSEDVLRQFMEIKLKKKQQLAEAVRERLGFILRTDMVFDVQVKRLHEYKRQLLNALSIMAIYDELKAGRLQSFVPTTFIFGAKAAPGYDRAKAVIHLINMIAEKVNTDPATRDRLQVLFIPDYNCSWAELIIPAADISEQISPAGTEASGTGNMKLMLNGAVTLGTYDGANIEIAEEAGRENEFIFGADVQELQGLSKLYNPWFIYESDPVLHRALGHLADGTFTDTDGRLKELYTSLLNGASWHAPDHYYVLYDFKSYLETKLACIADTRNQKEFARKCLMNVASAGKFSSDRTIREYAKDIWNIQKVKG